MRITVFTPTYNRAHTLPVLYASLRRQGFHDFEWLIVDDGSQDGTHRLVEGWMTESNAFTIRYERQENGGKCRAINRGLELAKGELFFTVDSDDYLTDDALEKVCTWFMALDPAGEIQGIVANRGYTSQATTNYLFSEAYLDKSLLDIYSFYRNERKVFDGERAFVFYTDFHRKYKYPEFEGENFMTEAVAWNRMAHDGYKMRFYNDIIWVFEYKSDGLTMAGSGLFLRNPRGYGLWLRERAAFLNESLPSRLRMIYTFTCDLADTQDTKTIAESIGAPRFLIRGMRAVHAFRAKSRG